RPQVDGRRNGRDLTHGAVTQVVRPAIDGQFHRRKDEGDGRRGQQVVVAQAVLHAQALRTRPGLDGPGAVEEGDVFAAGVAGGGHRDGVQVTFGQHLRQAVELEQRGQEVVQRL